MSLHAVRFRSVPRWGGQRTWFGRFEMPGPRQHRHICHARTYRSAPLWSSSLSRTRLPSTSCLGRGAQTTERTSAWDGTLGSSAASAEPLACVLGQHAGARMAAARVSGCRQVSTHAIRGCRTPYAAICAQPPPAPPPLAAAAGSWAGWRWCGHVITTCSVLLDVVEMVATTTMGTWLSGAASTDAAQTTRTAPEIRGLVSLATARPMWTVASGSRSSRWRQSILTRCVLVARQRH